MESQTPAPLQPADIQPSSPAPQAALPTASESLQQLAAQTLPTLNSAQPQPAAEPQLTVSPLPQQPQSPVVASDQQPPPAYNNIYTEICTEIIKAQGKIIGMDMALEQAQGIEGLTVDPQSLHSTVLGDGSRVINELIQKYKSFFGYAAVEVCREAASHLLPRLTSEQTPALLNTPYH